MAALTKVLPSSTVERNRSGRSIMLDTSPAPLTPLLTKCSNLTFCREIKAVSELEKKADKRRHTTRSTKYSASESDTQNHPFGIQA